MAGVERLNVGHPEIDEHQLRPVALRQAQPHRQAARDHPADVGVAAQHLTELAPPLAVRGDEQDDAPAAVELARVQREQRRVGGDLERFGPGRAAPSLPVVALAGAADLPVGLLHGQRSGRHGDQQHRLDVQGIGQPDQVLGPVDVHLALFPADGPRVLEAEDVREVPLPRIRPSKLAQTLHAELPKLLGRWMSQCFHGVCSLRQGHCRQGRNDCKRRGSTREFLGEIV